MSLATTEYLQGLRRDLVAASSDFRQPRGDLISRADSALVNSDLGLQLSELRFDCTLELARLCYLSNDSRRGLDAVSIALRLAEETKDLPRVRQMLTLLGALQGESGNLGAALESYMAAFRVCEQIGDAKDWALVWLNVSNALISNSQLEQLTMGVLDLALSHASQMKACELRTEIELSANTNLAVASLREGKYGLGLRAGRRALRLSSDLPEKPWTLQTLAVLLAAYGNVALRVRDIDRAEQCVVHARAIQSQYLTPRNAILIENLCGLFETYTGKPDIGVARIARCLEASKATMPNLQGSLLRSLIEAKEVVGQIEDANRLRTALADFCERNSSEAALFHHRRHIETITPQHAGRSRTQPFNIDILQSQPRRKLSDQTKILENLAVAAELSDDPSGEHPFRVARLAELIAREVGFTNSFCAEISVAARLHDIGKTGMPPELLRKRHALSASEREVIQGHTTIGAELLASTGIDELQMAIEIALHHHEHWDGSGYPRGLSGAKIPLAARITSVAETFDALTHDRCYRPRISVSRALDLMNERSGRSFEPILVQSLQNVVQRLLKSRSDLDEFLASDAQEISPFLRAQREMSRHIKNGSG